MKKYCYENFYQRCMGDRSNGLRSPLIKKKSEYVKDLEVKNFELNNKIKKQEMEIKNLERLFNQSQECIKEQKKDISKLLNQNKKEKIIIQKICSCYKVKGCLHKKCDFKDMVNRVNQLKNKIDEISKDNNYTKANAIKFASDKIKEIKYLTSDLGEYKRVYNQQLNIIENLNNSAIVDKKIIKDLKYQLCTYKKKYDNVSKDLDEAIYDIQFLEKQLHKK